MFEELKKGIIREISSGVGQVINSAAAQLQRRFFWFAVRTLALILAIIFCAIGIILFGAKFVGADLMFLTLGVLLLIVFLVSK
ncbi:MAG TPA: hypothetical protein VJJ82_03540 [Candidatus Nanoarchaeia archaeon]|nr:hypothetical protein [Candidatus Nanoarchaeia archaeon]